MDTLLNVLVLSVLLAPVVALVWLSARMLLRELPHEPTITHTAGFALLTTVLSAVVLGGLMIAYDTDRIVVHAGQWFGVGHYGFELTFLLDRLSLPFVVLIGVLMGVVTRFSASYLHRDPGHARFHLLLLLFATGMLLVVLAGSIDLLFAGWELVGVSSALLIAFFDRRAQPARNGLRAFAIYRLCDAGLLVAAVLIQNHTGSADLDALFDGREWPDGVSTIEGAAATSIALLLVFAAMGKSAQVPFGGWLPRAMEGPTPSSAIFYGGLSIHAGAYLLLRMSPLLEASPLAAGVLVAIGGTTAIYATMVGRAQTDAKNQLAYASMAQVGLILVEIGLGLRMLALVHIAGHACVRTLQFLRAPSLLHEFHRIHAAAGGHVRATGVYYEMLLPAPLRRWLYAIALHRGGLDAIVERFIAAPVLAIARGLDRVERRLCAALDRGKHDRSGDPVAGEELER